jgi:tetratricopeptide (TPR) repeat protein
MLRFLAFALLCATATTARAQDSLEAEARANFEAGRIAFVDGRFADALPYFERAHELTGRPELLYNIGVCRDRIGHDVGALEAFEAYLAAIPDAANRSEVEQRIETARLRVARMADGGEGAPESEVDAGAAAPSGSDPTGWILAGAGAAIAAAGGVLVGVGAADRAGIEGSMGTLSWSDATARASSADGLVVGGAIGLGVGAGLAALGLGLALAVGGPEAPAVAQISPTGLRVSW